VVAMKTGYLLLEKGRKISGFSLEDLEQTNERHF
jgi:hypothetical protein